MYQVIIIEERTKRKVKTISPTFNTYREAYDFEDDYEKQHFFEIQNAGQLLDIEKIEK